MSGGIKGGDGVSAALVFDPGKFHFDTTSLNFAKAGIELTSRTYLRLSIFFGKYSVLASSCLFPC